MRPRSPALRGSQALIFLGSIITALVGLTLVTLQQHSLLSDDRAHAAAPDAAPTPGDAAFTSSSLTSSSTINDARLFSESVGKTLPYLVYLPPGYDANPTVSYPVLYLLHGMGGTYTEWYGYGMFESADRLIRAGTIAPMIIVTPEGEQAYWVDHAGDGPRWGTYVAHDLVAEIDGRYRTMADREHRAIGGMSMGGNGALQLAMNNPDVFGVVGAHSFALRRRDTAPSYFGDQAYFDAHDPVYLFRTRPAVARGLTLWLDVGNDDRFRPADEEFNGQLSDEGIARDWHEYTGGHEGAYWAAHTADYLRFYGTALARGSAARDEKP